MKQIIIDVTDTGEIKLETRGFTGKSCIEESEFIKALLGNEIARDLVPVYYQTVSQTVKKHLPLCG